MKVLLNSKYHSCCFIFPLSENLYESTNHDIGLIEKYLNSYISRVLGAHMIVTSRSLIKLSYLSLLGKLTSSPGVDATLNALRI